MGCVRSVSVAHAVGGQVKIDYGAAFEMRAHAHPLSQSIEHQVSQFTDKHTTKAEYYSRGADRVLPYQANSRRSKPGHAVTSQAPP